MRCEGCQRLFCLPCMSKHHEQLAVEFQLLLGVQRELKESFDVIQSNWENGRERSCLVEIDRWEQEVLARIRQVANQARMMVNEMTRKNMSDIHRRLDQLAFDMEQRQEEGNFLDKDIAEMKRQLEQLNSNIANIHTKVRVNSTAANKIDWNTFIYVTNEKKFMENRLNSMDYRDEERDRPEKLWTNLRKLIRNKQINMEYRNKHHNFERSATSIDQSITLTRFDSSEHTSSSSAATSMLDNPKRTTVGRHESFNERNFVSIDHDQSLPQATDV